jgi:uncharacterized protein YeaO (DUF488 family)
MAVRVVRLGTPRHKEEGPRLGTVRRPPRGVRKADFARLDYYDEWLPLLAPSQRLVSKAMSRPWTDSGWRSFEKAYRREMHEPAPRQMVELLARLSHHANFSIGCYCERADRCHRSVLRALLAEQGARFED